MTLENSTTALTEMDDTRLAETSFLENTRSNVVVRQRTLARSAALSGVGLHSGVPTSIVLHPAPVNSGILLRRADVAENQDIRARWDAVADTRLCSVLANVHGVSVGTVEHLMAALAGCGVDNVLIEVEGPEIPVMDGSSEPFVALIRDAGVAAQPAARRVIRILKPVTVAMNGAEAALSPADVFSVDMAIDFQSRAIAKQSLSLGVVNGAFARELAKARTFGFLHEVEAMRAAGLARGGSLENAVVVDGDKIINEEGLRFDDEFVRHKALDAIGDLYLAGAQIVGAYRGVKSGHAVNNALLHALFADDAAWTWDEMRADEAHMAVDGDIQAV